ncbi:hypothetical protein Tco_0101018, partial [Tanacetum coccineum]
MNAVPPPMTGNYMLSGPDVEIDYSQFTYGPKQSQTGESETQTIDFDTCESDCSVETNKPLPEPTVNEPKVVNTAKQLVLLGDKGKLLLIPQQVVIGDHKDTTGTKSPNTMVDQVL